jgi:hypothetical protein
VSLEEAYRALLDRVEADEQAATPLPDGCFRLTDVIVHALNSELRRDGFKLMALMTPHECSQTLVTTLRTEAPPHGLDHRELAEYVITEYTRLMVQALAELRRFEGRHRKGIGAYDTATRKRAARLAVAEALAGIRERAPHLSRTAAADRYLSNLPDDDKEGIYYRALPRAAKRDYVEVLLRRLRRGQRPDRSLAPPPRRKTGR